MAPSAFVQRLERRGCADERPEVQRDDALHVRRAKLPSRRPDSSTKSSGLDRQRIVEAPLEADRRRGLRAHAARRRAIRRHARERPRRRRGSSASRRSEWKRSFRSLARLDREVGARRVADEERVAGEHEPRLVGALRSATAKRAVLGPVARACGSCGSRPRRARPSPPSVERLVRVLGLGRSDGCGRRSRGRARGARARRGGRRACASRARRQLHVLPRRLVEVLLDRVGRVDDHGDPLVLIADRYDAQPRPSSTNWRKITNSDVSTSPTVIIRPVQRAAGLIALAVVCGARRACGCVGAREPRAQHSGRPRRARSRAPRDRRRASTTTCA